MNILIILLRIVEVLVCLMLVGIILMQRSKGSGAGVSFGGGAAEAIFGAQMGNVLTKTTVILGFVFLANTLALSILQARSSGISADGSIMDGEPPAAARPRKLPNKERKELQGIPGRITALEAERDDLHRRMAAPEFYKSPPADIQAATTRAAKIPTRLDQLYARWAELEADG